MRKITVIDKETRLSSVLL